MRYPYLITSDQHAHAWSAFSKVNPDGVNSRLRIILDELHRAHQVLHDAGGNESFYAGDLFHVRGKIEPSVFNPTFKAISDIHARYSDLASTAIPGNHDLEGRDADELGNAMQQLGSIDRFVVSTKLEKHGDVIVIPWQHDLDHLRTLLAFQAATAQHHGTLEKTDVIIHAPVNGVLMGIPDHGLEASELAAYGFRRVFCGHYHDHKVMMGGKVISVGATSHQTWSDPGTMAGFILVYEDRIQHFGSAAPQFINLDDDKLNDLAANGDDIEEIVKGHYVRLKLTDVEEKDIKAWRQSLTDAGVAGQQIIVTKTSSVSRTGASTKAAVSLSASVDHYIRQDMKPLLLEDVSKMAQDVLAEAMS